MNRDEFIQAMIGELSLQKKTNENIFMMGKPFTAKEIFQKLCYDYPLVDESSLEIFLHGIREFNQYPTVSSLKDTFVYHPKLLENILHMAQGHSNNPKIDDEDDDEDDLKEENPQENPSDQVNNIQKQGISSQILAELFISCPHMLLTQRLTHAIHVYQLKSTAKTLSTSSLILEILQTMTSTILSVNSSQFILGIDDYVITKHQYLSSIVHILTILSSFLSSQSANSSVHPSKLTQIKSNHEDILIKDYLLTMIPSTHEHYDTYQQSCQQLFHVYFTIAIDMMCQYPMLVSSYFTVLFDLLIQPQLSSSMGSSSMHSFSLMNNTTPNYFECLLLTHLRSFSQYFSQQQQSTSQTTIQSASLINLLRQNKELIRDYFLQQDKWLYFIQLTQRINPSNKTKSTNNTNNKDNTSVTTYLQLDTTEYILDLLELLLYSNKNALMLSKHSQIFVNQLTSTSCLSILMQTFLTLLTLTHQQILIQLPSVTIQQLWMLYCRLVNVFTRLLTLYPSLISYWMNYPDCLLKIQQLVALETQSISEERKTAEEYLAKSSILFPLCCLIISSEVEKPWELLQQQILVHIVKLSTSFDQLSDNLNQYQLLKDMYDNKNDHEFDLEKLQKKENKNLEQEEIIKTAQENPITASTITPIDTSIDTPSISTPTQESSTPKSNTYELIKYKILFEEFLWLSNVLLDHDLIQLIKSKLIVVKGQFRDIYRHLLNQRIKLRSLEGSIYVMTLDKITKHLKGILSLLEGHSSNKAD